MATAEGFALWAKLGPVIRAVDSLRDCGLEKLIELPKICVVGSQSAGKSSVLEAIVGIDFLPRGEGIVTRVPLEMRLQWDPSVGDPVAIFDGSNERMSDWLQVKGEIERLTNELTGSTNDVKNSPIIMRIIGSQVPNLTLIDLPGIARNAIGDQSKNIEELTKSLVNGYIDKDRAIILSVHAAPQDMASCDGMNAAKRADPEGIRTLGVITKLDAMNKGTDAREVFRNKTYHLKLGYVGVKLRSPQDQLDGRTIQDALNVEAKWFKNHEVYRSLPAKNFTVSNLSTKLSSLLYERIRESLPEMEQQLNALTCETDDRLIALGEGPPTDPEQMRKLVRFLANNFSDAVDTVIRGLSRPIASDLLNKNSDQFSGGAKMRHIMENLHKDYMQIDVTKDKTNDQIIRQMEQHQGDGLGGFDSQDVFDALIGPHLKSLDQYAQNTLNEVSEAMIETIRQVLGHGEFKLYPDLVNRIEKDGIEIVRQLQAQTRLKVRDTVTANSSYMFTVNPDFLPNPIRKEEDPILVHGQPVVGVEEISHLRVEAYGARTKLVTESGTLMSPGSLIGSISNHGFDDLKKVALLRLRLDKYYQIVVSTLREHVPKLIGCFLIRAFNHEARQIGPGLCQLPDDELSELICEEDNAKDEREELRNRQKTLREARKIFRSKGLLGGVSRSVPCDEPASILPIEEAPTRAPTPHPSMDEISVSEE